jgi:uncharacterized membrane protein
MGFTFSVKMPDPVLHDPACRACDVRAANMRFRVELSRAYWSLVQLDDVTYS